MSYEYEPTAKEQRAAERLREKGWTVRPPACPDCGGLGSISETKAIGGFSYGESYEMTIAPCPRGCTVSYFYSTGNSAAATWR